MASKKKVIALTNLRTRFPLMTGIVLWLFLDRLGVPDYVHGIVWTVFGIVCLGILCEWFSSTSVDIFKEEKDHGAT